MDEHEAARVAEFWSGGRGLVPRGPRVLLGFGPADPRDVERHTGRRPPAGSVWRVEVGGRFLRSGGVVYPGGVPYPEELQHQTAVVSSEVWLYVSDGTGDVMGVYSWPEAVRRPIAAAPREDFDPDDVGHPSDAIGSLRMELRLPRHPAWDPALLVVNAPDDVIVLCVKETIPDPLNEMLLFEQGGVSLRAAVGARLDTAAILREFQPPFRELRVAESRAVGRDPGRSLGPQTWPWPGELLWWAEGVSYQLKGFQPLQTLHEIAATLEPVTTP
jgi:hypothetical protein